MKKYWIFKIKYYWGNKESKNNKSKNNKNKSRNKAFSYRNNIWKKREIKW